MARMKPIDQTRKSAPAHKPRTNFMPDKPSKSRKEVDADAMKSMKSMRNKMRGMM